MCSSDLTEIRDMTGPEGRAQIAAHCSTAFIGSENEYCLPSESLMKAVAPAELHCLRKKIPSAPDGVTLEGAGGVAGGKTDSGTRGDGVNVGLAPGVDVAVAERMTVGSDGVLVDVTVGTAVNIGVAMGSGSDPPEQRASRGI